jgi:type IV secretion system protein VirB11
MSVPILRSPSEISAQRVRDKLSRELGAVILDCLNDPGTIEIMLNSDGVLWVERAGRPMQRLGLLSPGQAEALINMVAATRKPSLAKIHPGVRAAPDGQLSAIAPVVAAPVFSIRRRPDRVFTLADYVAAGIMTASGMRLICRAVEDRLNIVVAGGTGSGKTTLVNAVIGHMASACAGDRLIIMEDTPEIRCTSPNAVILRTSPEVSINRLIRATMRLRPDRIIIGEVRGEALN